jgi:enoyl-CoA hydratase/carnithine racemase
MVILSEIKGSVGWLTLNRPDAMNALNRDMVVELGAQLEFMQENAAVRAVVLTANGRAFCAGADLKSVTKPVEPGEEDMLDIAARVFAQLRHFPKPVIAAVNGLAIAGGMELVLACDLVLAADTALLGDAHANFGVFPGAGGAAVMPRKLPANVAKFLLFTGDTLSAADMKAFGLVNDVVAAAQLAEAAQSLGEKLAEKSPTVLRRMKRVANETNDKSLDDALRDELLELRTHLRSHDMQEGLRAFLEKRKPDFKGF